MSKVPFALRQQLVRIPRKLLGLYFRHQISPQVKCLSAKVDDLLAQPCASAPQTEAQHQVYTLSQTLQKNALKRYLLPEAQCPLENRFKVALHTPNLWSMGIRSLFDNWRDGLLAMGHQVVVLPWDGALHEAILATKPDLIVTVDHDRYLKQFDWTLLDEYRQEHRLRFGLIASPEFRGTAENHLRITNATKIRADFLISFWGESSIQELYGDWIRAGWSVFSMPFSANPLQYYYVPGIEPQVDFTFLGSSNPEKVNRYWRYLSPIFKRFTGLIIGPGWNMGQPPFLEPKHHSRFYQLGQIAINLHIPNQINLYEEPNERVYSLAASGVLQVVDHPLGIEKLFYDGGAVITNSPVEYQQAFAHYLHHPEERTQILLNGLKAVYNGHTIFHRLERLLHFVSQLPE